MRPTFHPPL
jgi:hypothetical protein